MSKEQNFWNFIDGKTASKLLNNKQKKLLFNFENNNRCFIIELIAKFPYSKIDSVSF